MGVNRNMSDNDRHTIETLFYLKNPGLSNRSIAKCVHPTQRNHSRYLKQIIKIAKDLWILSLDYKPYLVQYGKEGSDELFTGTMLKECFEDVQIILEAAFQLLEDSALKGNPMAMFKIGTAYMQGTIGATVNHVLGFDFLVRSAKKGCGFALYSLATYYLCDSEHKKINWEFSTVLLKKCKKDSFYMGEITSLGNGTNKENVEDMEVFLRENATLFEAKDRICRNGIALFHLKRHQIEQYHKMIGKPILSIGEWNAIFLLFGIDYQNIFDEKEANFPCESVKDFIKFSFAFPGNTVTVRKDDPLERICFHPNCPNASAGMTVCRGCYTPYCSDSCQESHWAKHQDICTAFTEIVNEQSGTIGDRHQGKEDKWLADNFEGMFIPKSKTVEDMPGTEGDGKCDLGESEVKHSSKMKEDIGDHEKAESKARVTWKRKQKKTVKKHRF